MSYRMQALRDNPATATRSSTRILDDDDPGLNAVADVSIPATTSRDSSAAGARPRVAILREQGVNSQNEMAAAFMRAGFEPSTCT